MTPSMNRRNFIKNTAGLSLMPIILSSSLFAKGSEIVKVALIGCGVRGKEALRNFCDAAKYLQIQTQIVALSDYFQKTALHTAMEFNLPSEICHSGIKSYQDVMKTEADVVLLVTPPVFRPIHFEATVKAGKHVFMEKPVAVDPSGARKIMEISKLASQKRLSVVCGTQRRHDSNYLRTQYAVSQGAIGPIRSGNIYWCDRTLGYHDREIGEKDDSYMTRNWRNFTEMSGDHIVEQHIHNIDVANWFLGRPPKMALGVGGRAHRKTGNQYDYFSVDYDYGNGIHVHSLCRQINGCYNRNSEFFTGAESNTWGSGPGREGFVKDIKMPTFSGVANPYVQEHIDLIKSIREGKASNEAHAAAESTMTAIMGRISAYTGNLVRWKDLMDETTGSPWYDLKMKPRAEDFENGTVKAPPENVIPILGKE